jgi:hypothetical protein
VPAIGRQASSRAFLGMGMIHRLARALKFFN